MPESRTPASSRCAWPRHVPGAPPEQAHPPLTWPRVQQGSSSGRQRPSGAWSAQRSPRLHPAETAALLPRSEHARRFASEQGDFWNAGDQQQLPACPPRKRLGCLKAGRKQGTNSKGTLSICRLVLTQSAAGGFKCARRPSKNRDRQGWSGCTPAWAVVDLCAYMQVNSQPAVTRRLSALSEAPADNLI